MQDKPNPCDKEAKFQAIEIHLEHLEKSLTDMDEHLSSLKAIMTPEHMEFLVQSVEEKRLRIEFWRTVRLKVATAGIWGTIILVCSVLVFAFESWIKRLAGG